MPMTNLKLLPSHFRLVITSEPTTGMLKGSLAIAIINQGGLKVWGIRVGDYKFSPARFDLGLWRGRDGAYFVRDSDITSDHTFEVGYGDGTTLNSIGHGWDAVFGRSALAVCADAIYYGGQMSVPFEII